jgi:bacterial/archaeal transporter family protein
MWLVFSLTAAFFWAVGQIFLKKGLSQISPLWNNIIVTVFYFIIFIPFALSQGAILNMDFSTFLILLVISALYITYYYAIGKGELALTGTVIAGYPIITSILSVIFLKESLTILQIVMICLTIFGGILIALPSKGISKVKINSWIIFAIGAAFSLGIADFLIKIAINRTNVNTYNLYYPLSYLFCLYIYWLADKKGRRFPKKTKPGIWFYTLFGIGLIETGLLFFNVALSKGQVSLVSPISSTYAALTVILAVIFLKEKLSKIQIIGTICMVAGIIFVAL